MKKLFTFFATAMMAFTMLATDYTGTLTVTINGESSQVPNTTISVVDNGGNSYTLSINNFMLDEDTPIGNIIVNTNGTDYNGATMLKTSQSITIADGDSNISPFWLGSMLGEVPINMTALFKDGAMYTNIDIYMAALGQIINVSFTSDKGFTANNPLGVTEGYQLAGGDFEEWTTWKTGTLSKKTWYEPRHWHSFGTATGLLQGQTKPSLESSATTRPGTSGSLSARLYSNSIWGVIANGTFTTGRMSAASTSADDASGNYAFLDMSATDLDKFGDKYGLSYTKKADALKVWVKFTQGTANADYPYASVSAIITDGTYYQDPEANYTSWQSGATAFHNKVATAKNNTISASSSWQELTIPFDYNTYRSDNVTPQAALITISTNATPGKGSSSDEMLVDDVTMVYYGDVTGITVNGLDNFAFDAATHTYNVEAPGEFTEDDVTVTKTGEASYLLKSVNAIEGGYVITVTVIPNDMSKAEVYTINITTPIPSLYVLGEVNGNNWEYNVGAEMTYNAEVEQYELNVHAGLNEDSKWAYFSLTKGFGNSWEETNALRLGGAAPAYNNCEVTTANQNGIALLPFNGETEEGGKTFQIPAGDYKFIVNKDMTVFKVEGDIVVPIDEMYIAGTFTGWNDNKQQMTYDAETESYSITVEGIENGAQFKFIKNNEWYGADSNTDTHVVHPDWCTDIQLTTPGKNFEVNGQGDLTFTVDKDMQLTITGWTPAGVTLAEALAGENGDKLIISDMAVVVANENYAIVTDGQDNWLKVTGMNDVNEGSYITNLRGTLSDVALNPVLAATAVEPIPAASITVTPKRLNLGTIHRTALTELKPNEVAQFVGYYVAERGELCAFSSGNGLHLEMTMDNMVGQIVDGKQQTITAVVSLKNAWDAPAGAPARVAINDDQAFENISIDATAASVPTGLDTVKAIDGKEIQGIYNVNGQQVNRAERGIYIIRYTDGTAAKVQF